ncbi:MAG: hypothetical protein OXG33_06720 [Chloroflexi bacterium]|nr:hypothetical protein [Chloroflexota bacterium]
MSRFVHLSRVGRRSLGAVLLLACMTALVIAPDAGSQTPPGTAPPVLVVPAGEAVRAGDVAPDDVIRYTWDALGPIGREQLGITSLDDLRNMVITGPHVIPEWSTPNLDNSNVENDPDAPVPDDALSVTVTPEISSGKASTLGDGAVAMGMNPCKSDTKKANIVHRSRTFWCYTGTVIADTPALPLLKTWVNTEWQWEGIVQVKYSGTPKYIKKTAGGIGHDRLWDEAKGEVKKEIYVDNEPGPDVCYKWNSYIQKRQYGNGNTGPARAWAGSQSPC